MENYSLVVAGNVRNINSKKISHAPNNAAAAKGKDKEGIHDAEFHPGTRKKSIKENIYSTMFQNRRVWIKNKYLYFLEFRELTF